MFCLPELVSTSIHASLVFMVDISIIHAVVTLKNCKWNELTPITKVMYHEISPYVYIYMYIDI